MKLETVQQARTNYAQSIHDITSQISLVKITHELQSAARQFFDQNGFIDLSPHLPSLTRATGSCENLDTTYRIRFFNRMAYLAQTEQLYLETQVPYFKRVCCQNRSFRAEPQADSRHLCEFSLFEFEEARLTDAMSLFDQLLLDIQTVIQKMVERVLSKAYAELTMLAVDKDILGLAKEDFPRISYTDAVERLELRWGSDLKSEHEKLLGEHFGNRPFFITRFPKRIKFFNMKENEENPEVVNSADLILPYGGEAVGAAEREYEFAKVKQRLLSSRMYGQLLQKGGDISDFAYFLENLQHNGSVPHAGCGIGFNRVVQYVCQLSDIRSTTLFPIYRGSIY